MAIVDVPGPHGWCPWVAMVGVPTNHQSTPWLVSLVPMVFGSTKGLWYPWVAMVGVPTNHLHLI